MNLILYGGSFLAATLAFFVFYPFITSINSESTTLITIMFLPAAILGLLYGKRITERAISPSETRSQFKRSISKIFLFLFVMGSMFSSVNFAINGGNVSPVSGILEEGLISWTYEYVANNGGAVFLIISSISLMAAATRRVVGFEGIFSHIFTMVGTFIFFSMLFLTLTQSDPTKSVIYLYTFYHAGIVGGILYSMNKLTRNSNYWEDYLNGN
ncbi:MAG: putative membrane protein [Cenarchaeum symbiont of Oopsacas minuta]|nr:putative membrane protein [Cenarchaeum symbiont of Oopsacas minuta]